MKIKVLKNSECYLRHIKISKVLTPIAVNPKSHLIVVFISRMSQGTWDIRPTDIFNYEFNLNTLNVKFNLHLKFINYLYIHDKRVYLNILKTLATYWVL